MSNPEDLLLATFLLDMQSDQCGYPICCPGNQPKFQEVNFFPTSISHLNMEADIRELMDDTAKIFHETGMPMLPCLFHHFCLPFSPICAAMYCANQRKSRLDDLIKDFNHQKALEKGIFIGKFSSFSFTCLSNDSLFLLKNGILTITEFIKLEVKESLFQS